MGMGRRGNDPAGMGTLEGRSAMGQPLRQMHAIRADPPRKPDILTDQQFQAARSGNSQQSARSRFSIGRSVGTIDDRASRRQSRRSDLRFRRPDRVGEEHQCRQGLPQRPAGR